MNSKIQSAFSLSFQQLTKSNFIKIFFFHFALTFIITGIVVYFNNEILFGYVNHFVTSIFNFFNNILNFFSSNYKPDTPSEESISTIAKLITYFINYFIFIYILIPISTIIGLMFEDIIFKKILEYRKVTLKFSKLNTSFSYLIFFVTKNILIYMLLNIIAIPFYLTLPAINIIIFVILNGYILGVQTYNGIILSYFHKLKIRKCISQNRSEIVIIGMSVTLLYLIPLINFFAPLLTILIFINYVISKDFEIN